MTERSFPRAFRRLVGAFHRYHDVSREPECVGEKARARIELDEARAEARLAHDRHFVDPPTPDHVEPGLGTDSRTWAGKIAAVLFIVIVIATIVLTVRLLDGVGGQLVEAVEGSVDQEIVSTAAGVCRWDVAADLRNTTDAPIVIRSAWAETARGIATLVEGGIELAADSVTPVELSFVVPNRCPDDLESLAPGTIRVNEGGSSSSRFVDFTIGL
jgi:hypothetical protein